MVVYIPFLIVVKQSLFIPVWVPFWYAEKALRGCWALYLCSLLCSLISTYRFRSHTRYVVEMCLCMMSTLCIIGPLFSLAVLFFSNPCIDIGSPLYYPPLVLILYFMHIIYVTLSSLCKPYDGLIYVHLILNNEWCTSLTLACSLYALCGHAAICFHFVMLTVGWDCIGDHLGKRTMVLTEWRSHHWQNMSGIDTLEKMFT